MINPDLEEAEMKLKSSWVQAVLAVTLFATPIAAMAVAPVVVQAEEAGVAPVQWMKEITPNGYITGAVGGANGEVYVYGRSTRDEHNMNCYLTAFTADGKQKWYLDLGVEGIWSTPVIDGEGMLRFVTHNFKTGAHKLHAVAADGTQKWSYSRGPYSKLWWPEMGEDGTVYVANYMYTVDGTVTAFAPSGKIKWDYPFPGKGTGTMQKVAENGHIYARDSELDRLIVLNSQGEEVWTYSNDEPYAPYIQDDGSVIVEGKTSIVALGADGSTKWTWRDQLPFIDPDPTKTDFPLFVSRDGMIYFPSDHEGTVLALNADGTKKWENKVGDGQTVYVFHERGGVFYAKTAQSVLAFSEDGVKLWEQKLSSEPNSRIEDPRFGLDGTIYLELYKHYEPGGSLGVKETVAIAPSGEIKWRLGDRNTGSGFDGPLLVGPDGTVYSSVGSKLYAVQGSPVEVILNGESKTFTQPPVIRNGRTLVPMREIFEALGCDVAWDQATQTVTAVKGETEIKLPLGAKTAKVNGIDTPLETGAQLVNDRTMVPVRFVSEALGAKVAWDGETKTISIMAKE